MDQDPKKQSQESMPDFVPMSAQQEQDELIIAAMRDIPDEPEAPKDSRPSFADGSPGLQWLKEELLARGMSEPKAEEFLRMI